MIHCVICDVGNVIVTTDEELRTEALVNLGVLRERAILFEQNEQYEEFARGSLTEAEFYHYLIDSLLGVELTLEQIVDANNQELVGVDHGVIDLLRRLKVRLAIATDTNKWQTARVNKLIDLTKLSSEIFCSDEIGKLKRDSGTFELILKRLKVVPEETLFVDDSPEKIKMARKAKMQVIQFVNVSHLEQEFLRLGLIQT